MEPMHFTRSVVSISWDVWVSLPLSSSQLTCRWTHRAVDQSLGSFQLSIFTPAAFPAKERQVASRGHLKWWRESVRDGQESMQGSLLTRAPLVGVLTTGKLFHILSTSAFPQRHAVRLIGRKQFHVKSLGQFIKFSSLSKACTKDCFLDYFTLIGIFSIYKYVYIQHLEIYSSSTLIYLPYILILIF